MFPAESTQIPTGRRVETGEHVAALVHHADRRPLLADVGDVLGVEVDVRGLVDVPPLGDEPARSREDLDAAVLAVADVDVVLAIDPQAVGEVKLSGFLFPGFPPGVEQDALAREAVDPAVAVAVRDVQITRRCHHHLGRLVERSGRARRQLDVLGGARVGGLAAGAENHQGLAVQSVLQGHVVVAVGQVDHVIDDAETVGVGDGAAAPGAEVVAVAVEHDDGWILPLKRVDAVLRVGGHRAHLTEGPPAR
jgi:hypothetical protein